MKRKIFTLFAALIVGASTLFASDAVASVQHDNRSRYVRFQSNDLNLTAEIQSKSTPSNLVSNTTTSLEVNYAQAVYYPSYSTSKAYNWSIDLINLTNSTDYTIGMSIDLNTPTLTRIAGTWTTANGISLTYSSLVFVNGTDTTALAATDVVLTLDYQGQDTDNNPIYTVTATMTCDDDNIYTVSSTLVFYCYNAETDETIIINEPINGIYYIFDDANLTATVAYRGNYSSSYTNEYTGNVVIPATVTYGGKTYSVTSIGYSAFEGCSGLTSVVWNAKNCADDNCSFFGSAPITSFTFGSEVEHIPAYLCYGMSNLTSVTIPNSVTSIGGFAFDGCSGLHSVVWNAKNCADFEYSNYAPFYDIASPITSFTFGDAVEHIPSNLCYGLSSLNAVTIPNSVTSIGDKAFAYCSGLTSITIPNSVTNISYYAFAECSGLTSVTIGNSVTSIEDEAFYGCSKLKTVVIGNAVTNIGRYAFYGCNRLIYVTCYAEEPPFVGADPFSTYNAYLKVPCSGLDAYKMYDVWRDFNNISCIGSEEVQVTEFSVTPSTNEAQFTWPAESGAATYELVISKDGVVFCTLTFNASGQLMGIAFAPSANAPAAAPTTSGFQFTVTGLDAASHYTYTFDAKDADGGVIQHYAGEFNTDGYVGLEQIELANIYTQDGRIVCEGEFRIYDLLGRDVTRLNGSLCGVYVVKSGNATQKVVVK